MNLPKIDNIEEDTVLRRTFLFFSFGLSLISMKAGFYFYLTLFGYSMAIFATLFFEILRLSTIYILVIRKIKKHSLIGKCLYAAIAFTCLFAAAISYHTQIIEAENFAIANSP